MSSYITREDQYSKPPHKKLKDRQIDRQNRLNSPPSTIYKSSCATVYNGYGKGHNAGSSGGVGGGSGGGPGIKKTERRARSSPKSSDSDLQGSVETWAFSGSHLLQESLISWWMVFPGNRWVDLIPLLIGKDYCSVIYLCEFFITLHLRNSVGNCFHIGHPLLLYAALTDREGIKLNLF